MTAAEIRQSFLDFFASKGHTVVRSASLLPTAPNLLFTNAGMNPFVPIFLAEQAPGFSKTLGVIHEGMDTRAADTQKCIRAGGKHNDLEDVGFDTYHHTCFEMLGNWSFGDYFKQEAIAWAWELLTQVWKLPKQRLYATVYQPEAGEPASFDQEAYDFWAAIFAAEGLDPKVHIKTGNKKDNFWMMGDSGPCGPCSELHIDLTPDGDTGGSLVNKDSPWCIELWNLVFIQFAADGKGGYAPLKQRHVDTGMGFERVAGLFATTRGFTDFSQPPSNYNADSFTGIFKKIEALCGKAYGATMPDPATPREQLSPQEMGDVTFRVLADHVRTLCFAIADQIFPGNEGRNYVLRRILRRAVMFGKRLDLPGGFLTELVEPVIAEFGSVFPELVEHRRLITKLIASEETAFEKTLDRGLELFNRIEGDISGKDAFTLYDTYGFPLDLTQLLARERGIKVDAEGFEVCMQAQREQSRGAQKKATVLVAETGGQAQPTEFVGYQPEHLSGYTTRVNRLIRTDDGGACLITEATPFYPEMGGQVGDTGEAIIDGQLVAVTNTTKDGAGHILHHLQGDVAQARPGASVTLSVDTRRRQSIQRHHTATHLLGEALRSTLGDHVVQAGSLNAPDRLRFDFNHFEGTNPEQLSEIEARVNRHILEAAPVHTKTSSLPLGRSMQMSCASSISAVTLKSFAAAPTSKQLLRWVLFSWSVSRASRRACAALRLSVARPPPCAPGPPHSN